MIDLDPIPEEIEIPESNETFVNAEAFVEHEAPVDEDPLMFEEFSEESAVCAETYVPAVECFAQAMDAPVYFDARRHVVPEYQAMVLLNYVFKTLLFFWILGSLPLAHGASTEVCFTPTDSAAMTGSNNNLNLSMVAVFLSAILAFFSFCWMMRGRVLLKRSLEDARINLQNTNAELFQLRAAFEEMRELHQGAQDSQTVVNRRSNVLAVMYEELHSAYVRRTEAYNRARRAFVDAQTAARQYQAALQVAARDMGQGYQAILDINAHHAVCPLGDSVYFQDNSDVWHANEDCDELYNSGLQIRERRYCPICARQNLVVQDEDPTEIYHFDEHGVRVVDAPTWMDFT